jgi:hypothetical protein
VLPSRSNCWCLGACLVRDLGHWASDLRCEGSGDGEVVLGHPLSSVMLVSRVRLLRGTSAGWTRTKRESPYIRALRIHRLHRRATPGPVNSRRWGLSNMRCVWSDGNEHRQTIASSF